MIGRSRQLRLQFMGACLLSASFATGCSTSSPGRWGIVERIRTHGWISTPDSSSSPALVQRPAVSRKRSPVVASKEEPSAAVAAGVSCLTDEEPGESVRDVIRQAYNVAEQRTIADIVETNMTAAQVDRLPGRNIVPSTRLQIPKELPGAEAPPINLPPHGAEDIEGRDKDIARNFSELPTVPAARVDALAPGRSYTLEDLQSIALSANPLIPQAEAQIMALRGAAIQAGLHPNPVIGYEADTVGSGGTPNYHGGYVNTTIKTAGKLGLAESVANVDVWNADLMRQKARIDLITQVRGAYFAALIARENVKVTEALVRFTDSVYQIQLDQLKGGLVSVYEPIQLRALAVQARTALAQARNRYDAAWRQLAATVGIPGLQVGELEGTPDVLIPAVDYDVALPYVLANHTDVLAARNSEVQARYNLRLQEVTRIPDLMFYMALQKDYTTGPVYRTTFNTQVGVPVPVFDKNQGNIMNAHGTLLKASQEASRVQNDLASRLADAIERYKNASNIVQMYRDHILPDQARAYRGVYERHQQQPDLVGFADVVTAQQTLLVSINTYISSLATRWQALTDIGSLLQIETLDGMQAMTQPSGDLEVDLPEPLPAVPGNRGNERP
jgi:cobalt-zinc-cadmium efflux system outer membrane protein